MSAQRDRGREISATVLSHYPLSSKFRSALGLECDGTVKHVSVAELRQLSIIEMIGRLQSINGNELLIPVEDEPARAALPILQILASLTRSKDIHVIHPDLSRERFRRREAIGATAALLNASRLSLAAMQRCRRELKELAKAPRIVPSPSDVQRALYLNANLWFGVKAGGSVGHISGVINALLDSNYGVDFASAGGRLLVRDACRYFPLSSPKSFGLPFEYNYYRFSNDVVSQLRAILRAQAYGFLYQRMSLANYSGLPLSREFGLPLVLEYNGSEAWVAKNWGRPLHNHDLAVLCEDVSLKHAHLIVTVSDVLRQELIERGVEPERIVFYTNCIDEHIFDPSRFSSEDRKGLLAEYAIPENATVVTFIGTFGQWHGVDVLAQAIRQLAIEEAGWLKKHRVHFLIVGDGLKMPLVKEILSDERCRPFYTLTGLVPQTEAPRYLAASDVLVSPHVANADGSKFFGSPTKLFEYMAMGKGIVASDLDQIGDVLKDSLRAGALPQTAPSGKESALAVLACPGDVEGLIAGIVFLVDHPDWRRLLAANTRREALSRYTWKRHVGAVLSALRRAVKLRA